MNKIKYKIGDRLTIESFDFISHNHCFKQMMLKILDNYYKRGTVVKLANHQGYYELELDKKNETYDRCRIRVHPEFDTLVPLGDLK